MSNKENMTNITGLENSTDFKNDEYNLVSALLAASDFKNSQEEQKEIKIERDGKFYFKFTIRPLSEDEVQAARKKATVYMKNPAGTKYPPIPKETSSTRYNSYLIYTATVDEDRKKIWGNEQIKNKFGIIDDAETVDVLLKTGEKSRIIDVITDISGFDGKFDELSEDEFVKN